MTIRCLCDELSVARGCDIGGEVCHLSADRCDQDAHVVVALDAPEAPFGLDHAGGHPPLDHLAVAPVLDVAGDVAGDGDHRLDRVGA